MVIIFDLDGTLFQTEPNTAAAVRQLANEYGKPMPECKFIRHILGLPPKEYYQALQSYFNTNNIDSMRDRLREFERENIRQSGELYSDVLEMLEILSKYGHSMILCSSGSDEYIDIVLSRTKIGHFFERVISARNYENEKISVLGELIQLFPESVYVGDIDKDCIAANHNKMPFIAALYGYGDVTTMKSAMFTVQTPCEIVSCVARLDVLNKIREVTVDRGNRIIGINGIDTSGKTEFSEILSRFFDTIGVQNTVLHIDDYHNPREIRRSGDYYDNAFDLQLVVNNVLRPFRENGKIDLTFTCLDLDTNMYKNDRRYFVSSSGVLIVEGTLLFRQPVLKFLDSKIFLKIGFEEALTRAKIRDVPKYGEQILESYKSRYFPAQERYFRECMPESVSDIVINNSKWKYPKLEK